MLDQLTKAYTMCIGECSVFFFQGMKMCMWFGCNMDFPL